MVDSTTSIDLAISNTNAPNYIDIDDIGSTVAIFYRNMFALIKLREKGTTKLSKLPSGVFRCPLEYCSPTSVITLTKQPYKYNP